MSVMKILSDLTPLNRVICSTDADKTVDYLKSILSFRVLEYPASVEHNGWVIPPKWDVKEAKILKDGEIIYDAACHALAVIALSRSFEGNVSHEELKSHLHYDHRYDDSLTFHFRQQFRSWDRNWGFCVSKQFYDALMPGEYQVIIRTEESEGTMKVLEYRHDGRLRETIVFGANVDHPGVANDGLAGCVAGIELFKKLIGRQTKYSYRLVLTPGIIGSEYYLHKLASDDKERLMEGVFLEMLGSRTPINLQHSRGGESGIEFALKSALEERAVSHREGAFESLLINDEYLWETYGIPMTSFSRFPYPEYHSEKDDLSIISEDSLKEALHVLLRAIDLLESSPSVLKRFEGNICLSNPKYNLYVDPGQVAFGDFPGEEAKRMRRLMDLIPALRGPVTIRALADRVGLAHDNVCEYLKKWEEKGLLEIR
jgi:aminopeptidase-like protein